VNKKSFHTIRANERLTGEIISLNIDLITYQEAVKEILALAKAQQSSYICFANVHMVIEAYKDKHYAQQVNNASLVLADGVPLVRCLKSFYNYKQERIAGMDLFPDLLQFAAVERLGVFLFGSTEEVLTQIKIRAEADYPSLNIASFSPPFKNSLYDDEYVEMINRSGAHLVLVALGCPKQEKWMAHFSTKINAPLLGVGGAFPVYAGTTKRAPLFLRNLSLEWLYRLCQEPTRLFKRYLKTNILFVYLTVKLKIKVIFSTSKPAAR
jgi:N-acetylglucosaminyldiphosphoundecaprenol N-acetyl-beta-D-mannosaminyltransferase